MDMRYDMRMDGRRLPPRNARGEFRRRRSRRDRGIPYEHEGMRTQDYGDVTRRGRYGDYGEHEMRGGMDGHHPEQHGSTYYPIQAMGTFEGYYGMPEQSDYGMEYRRYGGSRMDYGYDMRGSGGRGRGRDYGYDYGDYGYDDYGDYGETLSEKELDEWCKKLKSNLDEREKQLFSKEAIMQKVKAMNKPMEGFGEKEIEIVTLMLLDDYKKTLGANPEIMVKLAYDWLDDKDAELKGAEKLAAYYFCIVEGEED